MPQYAHPQDRLKCLYTNGLSKTNCVAGGRGLSRQALLARPVRVPQPVLLDPSPLRGRFTPTQAFVSTESASQGCNSMPYRMLFGHTVAFLAAACSVAEAAPSMDLTARRDLEALARVRVHFEVGGELRMPATDKQKPVPISVVADLSYQQRWLEPLTDADAASPESASAARHYDIARATIKIDKGGHNTALPAGRRLMLATADSDSTLLVSPAGPLTRDELDLIDLPAGTHVLDRLMPGGVKKIGAKWKHRPETMQVLLGMDEVTFCEVESVLIGIQQGYAQVRLAGTVHGKTDGAATELEIKAGYLFDSKSQRITRLNLAFSEKREAGFVGPAVDVVGKLTLRIDPLAESSKLDHKALTSLSVAEPERRALLVLEDEPTGLQLLYDRQWHVTSQERERVVLRRIHDDNLLAQCNVTIRPARKEGRQSTMAEFEKEVRFALGKHLESLVTSGEWTNAAGLRCQRIVAQGKVEELPMEWRYYLASPRSGRSIAFAVSVEPQFVEQLGKADMALVESCDFASPQTTKPTGKGSTARKSNSSRGS